MCMLSSASLFRFEMNSNFVSDAKRFWDVVDGGVMPCPSVPPEEAVTFEHPVVKVMEPLIGFRNVRHQVRFVCGC